MTKQSIATLAAGLWSADAPALCGLTLGQRATETPPLWSTHEMGGRVRRCVVDAGGVAGIAGVSGRASLQHDRVCEIEVFVDVADVADGAVDDVCAAVVAATTAALARGDSAGARGARRFHTKAKDPRFDGVVNVDVADARVTVTWSRVDDDALYADVDDLPFALDALVDIVASEAWPRAAATAALRAWFRHEFPQQVPDDVRAAYFDVFAAALAARPDERRALTRAVVALATPTDFDVVAQTSPKTLHLLAGVIRHAHLAQTPPWVQLSSRDLFGFCAHFGASADVLVDVVDALAFDERAALAARLRAHPPVSPPISFDSGEDECVRAFDLVSAHLDSDEARLLWHPAGGGYTHVVALQWFDRVRGLRVDAPAVEGDVVDRAWAAWLAFTRAHAPHRFDDAVAIWAARSNPRAWFSVLAALSSSSSTTDGTLRHQLGSFGFEHNGKRWKVVKPKAPKRR